MKSSISLKPLGAVGLLRVRFAVGMRHRHHCEQPGQHQAFTRIELVVAFVASCLLVAALLLPAFQSGKSRARRAVCVENLQEIDLGLNQYAVESQHFLNAAEWASVTMNSTRIEPYLPRDPAALICPDKRCSVPMETSTKALISFDALSYGYNGAGAASDGRDWELGMGLWRHIATSRIKVPSDMIVLGDSGVGVLFSPVISPNEIASLKQSFIPQQPQLPSARHRGGANILFCDGHVDFGKQQKWIEKTPEARRQWNNDNQPHPETW
jgi:prepilin-type processing-associated H-X9-DG protein